MFRRECINIDGEEIVFEREIGSQTKSTIEMDCKCGGIIKGEGWVDENNEVLKFDFLECKKCIINGYAICI